MNYAVKELKKRELNSIWLMFIFPAQVLYFPWKKKMKWSCVGFDSLILIELIVPSSSMLSMGKNILLNFNVVADK